MAHWAELTSRGAERCTGEHSRYCGQVWLAGVWECRDRQKPAGGVDVVLGMSMMFSTFRKQLRLRYCFNEGLENMTEVERYLKEMERIVDSKLLS